MWTQITLAYMHIGYCAVNHAVTIMFTDYVKSYVYRNSPPYVTGNMAAAPKGLTVTGQKEN